MDDWQFDWLKSCGTRGNEIPENIFNVKDFGAVGDGTANDTAAIQQALDACEKASGGKVTFAPGVYLCGSLFIGNNTEFNLPKGSTLWGSQDLADYKTIQTRAAGIETMWPAAVLNAIDKHNVVLSGSGTLDGRGKIFWDDFWERTHNYYEPNGLRWAADYDCRRPRGVLIQNCTDVVIRELVIYRAGFWSVHVLYSQYVTVDDLCIFNNIEGHGPSTDGVDIDSCEYVEVCNCQIDCNDDVICLKAGRDADGLRVNRGTRYVYIHDCDAGLGAGLITFGSETSGTISNVLAERITSRGTGAAVAFKSCTIRGGGVHDIYCRNITVDYCWHTILFSLNWFPEYSCPSLPESFKGKEIPELWKVLTAKVDPEKGIPVFRDLHFRNIHGTRNRDWGLWLQSAPQIPVTNVTLENCSFSGYRAGILEYGDNWVLDNVRFSDFEFPFEIKETFGKITIK